MIQRSVTAKILMWCIAAMLISLAAFVVVSFIGVKRIAPYFIEITSLQRDDAIRSYKSGGPARLSEYLERLHQHIPVQYFLTDAYGKDLVNGVNRSALLAMAGRRYQPGPNVVVVSRSPDRQYCFVVVAPQESIWTFLPFYLLVPLAVCLLAWVLAVNVASPLRRMARAVEQFGRGDLTVRMRYSRKDEIGGVARAFDNMADRIEILLTAERRLLQDISHELRSPLTRIGFAAALTKSADDREAAADRLTKEISRLTELVNGLLQMTRVEGDPSNRIMQEVSLPELIGSVIQDCALEAKVRGCELSFHKNCDLKLYGDYELLRRAVENVVRNAIYYTPEQSSIAVTLEGTAHTAIISVRDSGPGVPDDALPKLFQPFFRVDQARSGSTGGVGLGLSIARRAVAMHGGSISAQNVHPGLLVSIELPIANVETP
ncbi:MAG TPA: ATP-binding protein [Terracidiphilus sp.]|nr:ATP-binding protein [Terracidiphilus sp.]